MKRPAFSPTEHCPVDGVIAFLFVTIWCSLAAVALIGGDTADAADDPVNVCVVERQPVGIVWACTYPEDQRPGTVAYTGPVSGIDAAHASWVVSR